MNGATGSADRTDRVDRTDGAGGADGAGGIGGADTIDVLVVDDDFMVARVHRAFVDRVRPFRVVGVASTGEQAVRAVDELHPDLVLLDLYLPDLFGLDVIPRLRTAGHDCDVMVISAAREADTVRGAARHGVVDYLLKPFEFEDLRARLDRYAVQRGRLLDAVVHGQADVDRVLAGAVVPAPGAGALPKGMSVETAALVERTLRTAQDTLSAAECATLAGLSRVSARRYLEHFQAVGKAEVTLRYGAAGRPERRYRFRGHAKGHRRPGDEARAWPNSARAEPS
ncbi:response regulator [Streptomyces beigongshangae]|uniref:response regulator n=1 Tax=Streptomyces beigongshangae TaxID=2841597 RepID=UPI001C855E09|nr:response regulator [Streptomyces sp. REN17]